MAIITAIIPILVKITISPKIRAIMGRTATAVAMQAVGMAVIIMVEITAMEITAVVVEVIIVATPVVMAEVNIPSAFSLNYSLMKWMSIVTPQLLY